MVIPLLANQDLTPVLRGHLRDCQEASLVVLFGAEIGWDPILLNSLGPQVSLLLHC